MDWITGIQRALDYIEENLCGELDCEAIAREAACSSFYFQRIFHILCGLSLGEYIRNRRLTLAGSELSATNLRVIDAALKYGYESPESFTRAFTKFHGICPAEARKNAAALRSFSRLSVQIILKGGNLMNYKIIEKPAFHVLEKVEPQSIVDDENKNTIPAFWTRCKKDGTIKTLLHAAADPTNLLGICYGNTLSSAKTFDYALAVLCDKSCIAPSGFRIREIPTRTWAVFECIGAMPDAIQQTWHQICTEFFPTSEYKPTFEMDIEVYPVGDMTSPDYHTEIQVAVSKA